MGTIFQKESYSSRRRNLSFINIIICFPFSLLNRYFHANSPSKRFNGIFFSLEKESSSKLIKSYPPSNCAKADFLLWKLTPIIKILYLLWIKKMVCLLLIYYHWWCKAIYICWHPERGNLIHKSLCDIYIYICTHKPTYLWIKILYPSVYICVCVFTYWFINLFWGRNLSNIWRNNCMRDVPASAMA